MEFVYRILHIRPPDGVNAEVVAALEELEQVRARLKKAELDLRAQECLHVSAYQSGVKAGWNLCVDDDHDGYQAATASTEHVAELKRIRAARHWIEGGEDA